MRLPTYRELRKFVEREGWRDKDVASGRRKGDHHRYLLTLQTGDVLYTRISHGSGQVGSPNLRAHILRDQLRVSEEDFWRCVDAGTLPPRPQSSSPQLHADRGEAIDAKLVRNLVRKVGLSQELVATLSRQDAVRLCNDYLAGGGA